jgi:hypothetical protein
MRKPNFFIVGAPKCGTTWLYHFLNMHPSVFMPQAKEPHHFNTDSDFRWYPQRDAYEALFAGAPDEALAIGEASVWYLHSRVAAANILAYQPQARFIAMVRNPLRLAPSMHRQLLFNQFEDVEDFATSWALQSERAAGRRIPKRCVSPDILQYRSTCALGSQVEHLIETVGRERVHIILHDDMRIDPAAIYRDVLSFLNLPGWSPPEFKVVHAARERRNVWLKRSVSDLARLKDKLGITRSFGFLKWLNRWNVKPATPTLVPREVHLEMISAFADDIARLEQLTGRTLHESWALADKTT